MKSYIKGLLTGLFIMIVVWCAPAMAQNVEVFLNQFAVNVDGIDVAAWGEEYVLDNGDAMPYSITYNDTTYLPMRKLAELMDKEIYWNGDSKKIFLTAKQKADTREVLAEKPDVYGNVWTYYTFEAEDGKGYLGVKDQNRNYERVYRLSNYKTNITEDALYFIVPRLPEPPVGYNHPYSRNILRKITFFNDVDTQDGTSVTSMNECIFDGDYAYGTIANEGSSLVKSYVWIRNLSTGAGGGYCGPSSGWKSVYGVQLIDSYEQEATLRYTEYDEAFSTRTLYEVKIYKEYNGNKGHIGEPVALEKKDGYGNIIEE